MAKGKSIMGLGRWLVAIMLVAVADGVHGADPDFQRDIRPILSNACFKCHGPDGDKRKGGPKEDR